MFALPVHLGWFGGCVVVPIDIRNHFQCFGCLVVHALKFGFEPVFPASFDLDIFMERVDLGAVHPVI